MPRNRVMVEINPETNHVVRIFNKPSHAFSFNPDVIREWPRSEAVKDVRTQIFDRSKGECELCGEIITWKTGEMHELIPRGKGGQISLENSRFLCYSCHHDDTIFGHGSRKPQWS